LAAQDPDFNPTACHGNRNLSLAAFRDQMRAFIEGINGPGHQGRGLAWAAGMEIVSAACGKQEGRRGSSNAGSLV
jgi:hypothetical protein